MTVSLKLVGTAVLIRVNVERVVVIVIRTMNVLEVLDVELATVNRLTPRLIVTGPILPIVVQVHNISKSVML